MTIILNGSKEDVRKLRALISKSEFTPLQLVDNYLVKQLKGYKVVKSRNWESGKVISESEIDKYL